MSGPARDSRGTRRPAGGGRAVRAAVVAIVLLVTGAVVYGALRDSAPEPDKTPAAPSASPTPLSSLDLSGLPIDRGPFCDALNGDDVERALGGPVAATRHYDSGDRAALAPGLTDVSHEYNCSYRAASGVEARAWVFAEPVTDRVAADIVRESTGGPGCRPIEDGPRFGTPSAGAVCTSGSPTSSVVTLRGLFGDTWLSCQLSRPGTAAVAEAVRRAQQWCVRVATTVGARP